MIIGSMGRKAEILLHLLLVLNEITMKLVTLIMWYAPFGILFLVAGKILEIDDMVHTARKLGIMYEKFRLSSILRTDNSKLT